MESLEFSGSETIRRASLRKRQKNDETLEQFFSSFPSSIDVLLIDVRRGILMDDVPPLGLLSIAGHLKGHGLTVGVIAAFDAPGDFSGVRLEKILHRYTPKLIGMNVYSTTRKSVVILAQQLKRLFKDIIVVIGGPEVSADAINILKEDSKEAINFAIKGEGEQALHTLLKQILNGNFDGQAIPGLVYREDDQIKETNQMAKIENINLLASPDWNAAPIAQFNGIPMMTARGCAHHCTFCFEGRQSRLRQRDIKAVLEEMDTLSHNTNVHHLLILDDDFTSQVKRLRKLLKGMQHIKVLPWFCEGRADVLSRELGLITEMVAAGMVRLQMGFESGSRKVLKAYKKAVTPEQLCQATTNCVEAGVPSVFGNFIIGGALEDEKTFAHTLDLALSLLDLGFWSVEIGSCYFAPHPGTEITEAPHNYQLELIDPLHHAVKWQNFCVNRTTQLTRRDIVKMKTHFDHTIRSKMCEQINTIPPHRLVHHLKLAFEYKIDGIWSKVLRSVPEIKQYSKIYKEYAHKVIIPDAHEVYLGFDWSKITPLNALPPQCLEYRGHQLFALVRWNLEHELNPLEQFIVFHADGTRTMADLYRCAREQEFKKHLGNCGQLKFQQAVHELAQNFAVVLVKS